MGEMQYDAQRWHLSKAIPVSIIMFLVLQTVAVIIWAVKLDSRVGVLEASQSIQDTKIATLDTAAIIFRMRTIEQRLDIQSQKLQALLELATKQSNGVR